MARRKRYTKGRVRIKRLKSPSGNCIKCGIWREFLQQDHIIPLAQGGNDTRDNIQLLCANCHEDKTRAEKSWGRKHTDEEKQAMKLRYASPATRMKMSETRKQMPTRFEQSERMNEARRKKREDKINEMYDKISLFDEDQ